MRQDVVVVLNPHAGVVLDPHAGCSWLPIAVERETRKRRAVSPGAALWLGCNTVGILVGVGCLAADMRTHFPK